MTQVLNLPEWASFRRDDEGQPRLNGRSLIIDVQAPVMYEALFDELRALYEERLPEEWLKADGELKKEWADALEDLRSETPSAYWCEVAYQMHKLDLQVSCRTVALNIHVHDPDKAYRQASRPQARDVSNAAGGHPASKRGKEARGHYKRLRGFLPA